MLGLGSGFSITVSLVGYGGRMNSFIGLSFRVRSRDRVRVTVSRV